MQAQSLQGLASKSIGPYMGVQFDTIVTFEVGGHPRHFRVWTYQAYNANGLIGPEMNGIAIADNDNRQMLADEIGKTGTGYFGVPQSTVDLFEKITQMNWSEFAAFINAHPRHRFTLEAVPAEAAKAKDFKFTTPPMADSQFMTAAQKATTLKAWVRFVSNGFKLDHFGKGLYNHLIQNCSFVAHFNLHGFYGTYFENAGDTLRFMGQFSRKQGCRSVEYGDNGWISRDGYADINKAMVDVIEPILPEIIKRLQAKEVKEAETEVAAAQARLDQLRKTA